MAQRFGLRQLLLSVAACLAIRLPPLVVVASRFHILRFARHSLDIRVWEIMEGLVRPDPKVDVVSWGMEGAC